MLVRTFWGAVGVAALVACSAGKSDGGIVIGGNAAPSCEDLNEQVQACATLSDKNKREFLPACKQARIDTTSCRRCLDGKLCDKTEDCDTACGK